MGRTLIVIGLLLVIAGVLLHFGEKLPFKLGRLPGDIEIRGKNSVVYLPIATCILLSVLLTAGQWLWNRFFR